MHTVRKQRQVLHKLFLYVLFVTPCHERFVNFFISVHSMYSQQVSNVVY